MYRFELPKYVRPERAAEPNWTSIYEPPTLLNRVRENGLPAQEYKHLELSALDFRVHFFKRTIVPPCRSSHEPFRIQPHHNCQGRQDEKYRVDSNDRSS